MNIESSNPQAIEVMTEYFNWLDDKHRVSDVGNWETNETSQELDGGLWADDDIDSDIP